MGTRILASFFYTESQSRTAFKCHALRGRADEYPRIPWPRAYCLKALRISYASAKNQKKRWPIEAQMEGWFPRLGGEHTRQ